MPKGTDIAAPAAAVPGTGVGSRGGLLFRLVRPLVGPPGLQLNVLAFLLARVSILGELAPFGLAFCAAVAQTDRGRAPAAAAAMLAGVLSTGRFVEAGVYLGIVLVYARFAGRLTRQQLKLQAVPLFVFAAAAVGGAALALWREAPLYALLLVFFTAASCVVLIYVFRAALPLLPGYGAGGATGEAVMCFVVLTAAAVAGLGEVTAAGLGVRSVAGSMAVMALALAGGPGLGASAGVAVGLVAGLGDGDAVVMIAVYGVAGLLAAAFRSLGKLAVIAGFLLGSAIAVLQLAPGIELTRVLAEAAVGAVLFAVIPIGRLKAWPGGARPPAEEPAGRAAAGEAVAKLAQLADIFGGLAAAVTRRADEDGARVRDDETTRLLAAVGERVCGQCRRRTECWDREYEATRRAMLEALAVARDRRLVSGALPEVLREGCVSGRDVADTVNQVAEQCRAAARWEGRAVELRRLAGEQLRAVGTIVRNLAGELDRAAHGSPTGALREQSALAGCPLAAVTQTENGGTRTVRVSKYPCDGRRECLDVVLPLAAATLNEPLTLAAECGDAGQGSLCRLVLETAGRLRVTTGWAAAAKERVSGDTAAVLALSGGRVALVLSDGMGTGSRAADDSAATVRFLERLLAAGFAVETAVKTVNSLLLLKLPAESFTTVDMAVIDACSGEAEFLKVGAAPSFVKRVREVATIQAASLPAGIVQQVELEPVRWLLAPGDTVVMVSDGVVELPGRFQGREPWVVNFLRRLPDDDPQALAEQVLRQAMELAGSGVCDDMTVLVAKVAGKAGLG